MSYKVEWLWWDDPADTLQNVTCTYLHEACKLACDEFDGTPEDMDVLLESRAMEFPNNKEVVDSAGMVHELMGVTIIDLDAPTPERPTAHVKARLVVEPDDFSPCDDGCLGEYANRPTGDLHTGESVDRFHGREGRSRNEFRYWNCAHPGEYMEIRKWYSKHGYSKGNADLEARRQLREAYERLESFGESWNYIWLQVKVDVLIDYADYQCSCRGKTSGGIGGVCSDSGEEYLRELVQEQEEEVRKELLRMREVYQFENWDGGPLEVNMEQLEPYI